MFQFHNGTINTSVHVGGLYLFFCFNSTTVQLIQKTERYHLHGLIVSIPQRYN